MTDLTPLLTPHGVSKKAEIAAKATERCCLPTVCPTVQRDRDHLHSN